MAYNINCLINKIANVKIGIFTEMKEEEKVNNDYDIKELLNDDLPKSDVPKTIKSVNLWSRVVKFQFLYSILGLVIGFILISIGVFLVTQSIGNKSELSIKILNYFFNIKQAAPGGILFIIGLVVIIITKFKITTK